MNHLTGFENCLRDCAARLQLSLSDMNWGSHTRGPHYRTFYTQTAAQLGTAPMVIEENYLIEENKAFYPTTHGVAKAFLPMITSLFAVNWACIVF